MGFTRILGFTRFCAEEIMFKQNKLFCSYNMRKKERISEARFICVFVQRHSHSSGSGGILTVVTKQCHFSHCIKLVFDTDLLLG